MEPTRRRVLGALATAATAGVAGCSSDTAPSADSSDDRTGAGNTETTAGTDERPVRNASGTTAADADSVYTRVYRETSESVALIRTPRGSQGSGFLYDERHFVTNYHVVGESDRVSVQFDDTVSRVGRVVGRDPRSDLAVIEVDVPDGIAPLDLIDSEPAIGTRVAVVGSPYGLRGSLTSGIVSGVDRQVPSPVGDYQIPNAIQTDAPVNPGNSGGPLVNLSGKVLGVVNSGGGDNIAFAISAALVRRVVPALLADGEYDHPYLGARTATVTELVARANGFPNAEGVIVVNVPSDVPAAGQLRPCTSVERVEGFRVPVGGDAILAVEGTSIRSDKDLHAYLALEASPDDTLSVRVRRDGAVTTVPVEIGARPELVA
ncbi:trypsin-like peptidase domain-containing protein [Halorussus gelatinilyticus]|uniref:Trypsin-like peptidase domain-containing protein n=1 Tax=Halorussus gelatinilyticus TaxID=2937524 RepID=A0A8U0IK77_9EURY|nr:trypsin-like peptidase domain-containing protein [Halorussus gelatinilyticus]UPW01158.1 trypsin-like peptidase domain-containing protein [Halorussus gelatinilyticus]